MIGPPPRRTDADPHTGPRRIGDGMSGYRISKYDPWLRDERGYFTGEDWTSFSDIGKEYLGIWPVRTATTVNRRCWMRI